MIHFYCPQCQKHLKAGANLAGKKTKCKGCGLVTAIPPQSEPRRQTAPPPPAPPRPAAPPPTSQVLTCSHCSGQVLWMDSLAGQVVQCPHCRGNLQMPAAFPGSSPPPSSGPTLSAACPHCRKVNAFDSRQAGQVVKCSGCQLLLQLPGAQGPASNPPPTTSAAVQQTPQGGGGFDFSNFDAPADDNSPSRGRRRKGGSGTTALILGLLGLLVFPLLGPVAIMVANSALRADRHDGGAKAGRILGWIATVNLLLGCCSCGVVGVLFATGALSGLSFLVGEPPVVVP